MPVIDTTKYGPTANAYLDIEDADELFDSVYGAEDWPTISDDDKVRLLITATEDIDSLVYSDKKAQSTQALNFPMIVDNTEVGFDEARRCCAIQAMYIYSYNDSIKSAIEESIQNVKTQNFGKVQTTKSHSGLNYFKQYDAKVLRLLAPYLVGETSVYRG